MAALSAARCSWSITAPLYPSNCIILIRKKFNIIPHIVLLLEDGNAPNCSHTHIDINIELVALDTYILTFYIVYYNYSVYKQR